MSDVPNLRVFAVDEQSGLEAFVVVDSLVAGKAMGGTRMTADVTIEEVGRLARAMTLKLALAGFAIGGAKAGIRSALAPSPLRDRQLTAFGRAIGPLLRGGVYLGSDQGMSHADRDGFLRAAGYEIRQQRSASSLPCSWADLWTRCDDVTGQGVCASIDAACDFLSLNIGAMTASIQGFGVVGQPVASGLSRRGARIVAVADRYGTLYSREGLPIAELRRITDRTGTIDRARLPDSVQRLDGDEAWLQVDADILVPAAGEDAITSSNSTSIEAVMVVEAGNLACSPDAHSGLARRAIPVLPGIAVNVGGAAMTALVLTGEIPALESVPDVVDWAYRDIASRIRQNVLTLFERQVVDQRPLREHALELAAQRALRLGTEGYSQTGEHPLAASSR